MFAQGLEKEVTERVEGLEGTGGGSEGQEA